MVFERLNKLDDLAARRFPRLFYKPATPLDEIRYAALIALTLVFFTFAVFSVEYAVGARLTPGLIAPLGGVVGLLIRIRRAVQQLEE